MADPTLKEIRTRWSAATPGPWSGDVQDAWLVSGDPEDDGYVLAILDASKKECVATGGQNYDLHHIEGPKRNLRAIIAAPTDIAWLLKRVEELEAEVKWCDEHCNGGPP